MEGVSPHICPRHIAIIMDGNGRWAASRGLPRAAGHREGAKAVRRTIRAAIDHGVRWLTLFAFSSENWQRPESEITDLTGLLRHYLRHEMDELHENGVRLHVIGERSRFGEAIAAELAQAEARTAANDRLHLVMALSYGGRADIVEAARRALAAGLDPAELDEAAFAGFLATAGIPDPDLLIRTSGEERISNFLLWQVAYAELFFTNVLWPDFDGTHFAKAVSAFSTRERRFGARPG